MYTWGHIELLQEVLETCSATGKTCHLTRKQKERLERGLKYPDFPCGTYTFDEKDPSRMVFKDEICSLLNVLKDISLLPNYFAASFASHNGYFSVWHSMTYNPERPVYKIARDIIDQIIAFLSLCFLDENTGLVRKVPNLLWVGMALHVIMDSYSPAHTLRCPRGTEETCTALVKRVKAHPAKQGRESKKANRVLKELKDRLMQISETIESNDKQHIEAILTELTAKHKIVDKKARQQLKATAMFLFFHNHHQIKIKRVITDKIVHERKRVMDVKSELIAPIVTFYSYPEQSSWFHKVNDTLWMLDRKGLREALLYDCSVVMSRTMKLVTQDGPITRRAVKAYLQGVYAYLTHATFKLAEGVADMNTGVDKSFFSLQT